ncbi:MAG TPA: alkaline phosphatase D family protein [Gemmataceae bacterium]|nr:alkaline phosphatase D family protein [Gemmataceae bacterium]
MKPNRPRTPPRSNRRNDSTTAPLTRREFIQDTTLLAAGLAVSAGAVAQPPAAEGAAFVSRWDQCHDRVWLGPEFWANPLQDWRLAGGRIECVNAALDRNVHLLTRQLGPKRGDLRLSVRLGRIGGPLGQGKGSAGFRIGIQGPLRDYRNSLIFGTGLDAGLTADGGLFIGPFQSAKAGTIDLDREAVELRLRAEPKGDSYTITLSAHDPADGKLLGQVRRDDIPADQLVGNLALVANFGRAQAGAAKAKVKPKEPTGPGAGRFWFADWRVAGSKVEAHDDQAFGPILFCQYTLSGGVMKMTAQMPPIGANESQTVRLQLRTGSAAEWPTAAEEKIHPQARTATFRVEKWNDQADVPYRLAYTMTFADGRQEEYYWTGTVRRDPADRPVLTVADISCNIHAAFPNTAYVRNLAKLDPDLLAFVGDQFYESTGGYGVVRQPLEPAILDYLRKWYMHGWTWRELTRDRPSLSLPDDHDVYQGNIWGEAGAPRKGTQEMGGYDMHPEWVNVVHRTQTAHHPDPYDPTPIKQNISVYYGPLTYGRVSFAVIADRQFKSGPEGKVPPTGGRGDHVTDPKFDPKAADVPGAQLLGERQMKFLRAWAADWRGADMKAVISQTIFTAMATTHGANRERLRADYDTNGWPQTPRNEALREIRKAFAVHLAGDQHLPAVVHYGIEEHRDGPVAFAGPAVNVGYPRWWEPTAPGKNRAPGAPENTGDFIDHFGHPLTVLAVWNGAVAPRKTVLEMLHDKASGLGLVRFDKVRRTITFECWPFLADPTKPGTQFPGWPVTVDMLANYGRKPRAHLPMLQVSGPENPVVQVIDEKNGEIVYTLRIAGRRFQPGVFAPGRYTIKVSYPETGQGKEFKGVEAVPANKAILEVKV